MENIEQSQSELQKKPEVEQHGEESVFSQASRTKKIITSFAVYYCTFAFAVGFTFLGPTVLDFSNKFDTTVNHVSRALSIMTGFYLVGAVSYGFLTRCLNRQFVVILVLCTGSATLFIYPHVTSISIFFVLAAFLGWFAGGYDTAQVAWIIDIWRHEAAVWILTQHFFYSLGTVVPPLLLSPFLKAEEEDEDATTITSLPEFSSSTESIEEAAELWIPFSIAGCIVAMGIFIQIGFLFVFRSSRKIQAASQEAEGAEDHSKLKQSWKPKLPPKTKLILIILSIGCISFYQGMEITTLNFLPTFAHYSEVHLSESKGADVLFGLTLAFCVFRAVGIILVLKVPPQYIIFGNFIILLVANLILVIFAGSSETWLWVGSVLMGMGLSTTFPAYFAYIEKYLFISDGVAATILLCGGGVSAIYPLIVGSAVETNPRILIYVNFLSLAVLISAFITTFWLTQFKGWKDTGIRESTMRNDSNEDIGYDNEVQNGDEGNNNNSSDKGLPKYADIIKT